MAGQKARKLFKGCRNAVTLIKTGDRIRVDGINGLVYKISSGGENVPA